VFALDNLELAQLIRDLEIDVLVDLSCYSTVERLPLFLDPPAPATLAWFNMYATSGLPGIQHIVGDHTVAPPAEDGSFTERVHRVAGSYLAFDVLHDTPPVAPPPCLENGFLTFGGLISQYKVTSRMLDIWAELLRRTSTARLLLANRTMGVDSNRSYLLDRLADRGVDTERVILLGPQEHLAFLDYYDRIDVALDSYPYNGGTTTTEALWQGVPVLSFPGDRWVSRTSASLVFAAGLDRWVAPDEDGMLEAAVKLAGDPGTPARLESLRSDMRRRLRSSAACDCAGLARELETIYREVW
jgi:predicted O-linked N-acetylglucosamine transferase (SPINDLY family)